MMGNINQEIGKRICIYRKSRNMTMEGLAKIIFKSKSTISKYEKGEITIDIVTLYEIADALEISIEQLLYYPKEKFVLTTDKSIPAFFKDTNQFYSYIYDGRCNKLVRCVFDVLFEMENNQYKIMMYMNFKDYSTYQNCENTYWGYIEHYDALTNIQLTNQDSPIEKASVQILASYLDSQTKWGLFNGFSSRPMMPVATKMLFSKKPIAEDDDLIRELKISREDIRMFKLYNMFSVI